MENVKESCISIGKKLLEEGVGKKELPEQIAIELGVTAKFVQNILGDEGLEDLYKELG